MSAALQIVMRRLSSMSLAEHSATDEDGSVPDHFLRSCVLIARMLFLPKSQPIHRQLLSGLLQVEGQHQQLAVFSSIQNQVSV